MFDINTPHVPRFPCSKADGLWPSVWCGDPTVDHRPCVDMLNIFYRKAFFEDSMDSMSIGVAKRRHPKTFLFFGGVIASSFGFGGLNATQPVTAEL